MNRLKRATAILGVALTYLATIVVTLTGGIFGARIQPWEVWVWGPATICWQFGTVFYWRSAREWESLSHRWRGLYEREHANLQKLRRDLS